PGPSLGLRSLAGADRFDCASRTRLLHADLSMLTGRHTVLVPLAVARSSNTTSSSGSATHGGTRVTSWVRPGVCRDGGESSGGGASRPTWIFLELNFGPHVPASGLVSS